MAADPPVTIVIIMSMIRVGFVRMMGKRREGCALVTSVKLLMGLL